ncbi:MAG: hypothetical protein U9Q15_04615 [Patescibacteria group bacterium]|nr:hypothetical protein [Patescibacteria group bacterium]
MSRENYQQFVESIKSYTEDQLAGKDLEKTLKIDTFLTLEDMHMKTIEMIDSLQPFGMGNPEPVFACMELRLDEVHVMGKEKEHMRFKFSWDNKQYSAVYWRSAEKWEDKLHPGMIVDIAGRLEKNEWNGKITLQLQIVDIHV